MDLGQVRECCRQEIPTFAIGMLRDLCNVEGSTQPIQTTTSGGRCLRSAVLPLIFALKVCGNGPAAQGTQTPNEKPAEYE
eukprot:scaffold17708_cov15-Tisochrysis_lutea.AAC.1